MLWRSEAGTYSSRRKLARSRCGKLREARLIPIYGSERLEGSMVVGARE